MNDKNGFAARFNLALRALALSRGRAATMLRVDKSLVGRWSAGSVRPSDHNLGNITRLVADHVPGFTMNDWQRDLIGFAARLGVDPELATAIGSEPSSNALPLGFLDLARPETQRRRSAYEGFWRTLRPSVMMPGKLMQDHGLIRASDNGMLEVRMGAAGLVFKGWAYLLDGNLHAMLHEADGGTQFFLIFRGVPLPKATLLDGILLLTTMDSTRTPAAVPILLERVGDLSGDREADDRTCEEIGLRDALADPASLPSGVREYLIRDLGEDQSAGGGSRLLTASPGSGFSRGASPSGELQG